MAMKLILLCMVLDVSSVAMSGDDHDDSDLDSHSFVLLQLRKTVVRSSSEAPCETNPDGPYVTPTLVDDIHNSTSSASGAEPPGIVIRVGGDLIVGPTAKGASQKVVRNCDDCKGKHRAGEDVKRNEIVEESRSQASASAHMAKSTTPTAVKTAASSTVPTTQKMAMTSMAPTTTMTATAMTTMMTASPMMQTPTMTTVTTTTVNTTAKQTTAADSMTSIAAKAEESAGAAASSAAQASASAAAAAEVAPGAASAAEEAETSAAIASQSAAQATSAARETKEAIRETVAAAVAAAFKAAATPAADAAKSAAQAEASAQAAEAAAAAVREAVASASAAAAQAAGTSTEIAASSKTAAVAATEAKNAAKEATSAAGRAAGAKISVRTTVRCGNATQAKTRTGKAIHGSIAEANESAAPDGAPASTAIPIKAVPTAATNSNNKTRSSGGRSSSRSRGETRSDKSSAQLVNTSSAPVSEQGASPMSDPAWTAPDTLHSVENMSVADHAAEEGVVVSGDPNAANGSSTGAGI